MNEIIAAFHTPKELQLIVAENVRKRRKFLGLTQEEFASRCGMSFGSYKRFETKGEISFSSLVKIAKILQADGQISELFVKTQYTSIEEVLNGKR